MSPPDSDRMVGTGGYHTRTSYAKCRVQGGVYLQDGRTQRQNFAQNGSQKLFCPGPGLRFSNKNFNGQSVDG